MGVRPRAAKDTRSNPRLRFGPIQLKEISFAIKMPKQRHSDQRILPGKIPAKLHMGAHYADNVSNNKCLREC